MRKETESAGIRSVIACGSAAERADKRRQRHGDIRRFGAIVCFRSFPDQRDDTGPFFATAYGSRNDYDRRGNQSARDSGSATIAVRAEERFFERSNSWLTHRSLTLYRAATSEGFAWACGPPKGDEDAMWQIRLAGGSACRTLAPVGQALSPANPRHQRSWCY